MANVNKVFLLGNLTKDPEARQLPSGGTVATAGIAVNRKWKKDGQPQEETTFVDIEAFNKTAEVMAQYCRKGSSVHVEGRLKLDRWTAKDGTARSKLFVVVDSLQMLDKRPQGPGDHSYYQQPQQQAPQQQYAPPSGDAGGCPF